MLLRSLPFLAGLFPVIVCGSPPRMPQDVHFLPQKFFWGEPVKLEKPIKSVAVGNTHTIILFEDGSFRCQGSNYCGESTPPVNLKTVLEVVAGDCISAARLEDGSVATWGQLNQVPGGIRAAALKAAGNDLFIVTPGGKVWSSEKGFLTSRSEAVQVAVGDGVYYLDKQGNVFKEGDAADAEPVFQNTVAISGTSYPWFIGALLKDGTVHIHNQGTLGTYEGSSKIAQFARSNSLTHGILPDGSISTWSLTEGMVKWPKSKTPAVKIFAGQNNAVALYKDGTLRASGVSDSGCLNFLPAIQTVTRVKCTHNGGCVYFCRNGLTVVTNGFYGALPAGFPPVNDADTAEYFDTMVTKSGTLYAAGDNTYGCCEAPPNAGIVAQVCCGFGFVIALRSNGTITAWGNETSVVDAVLAARGKFISVAAGGRFAVALTRDGKVVTFPDNKQSGFKPQPGSLPVITGIAAGYEHVLAVSAEGKVFSWGWGPEAETNVPADLPFATAVAAGFNHSVALLKDGTIAVWGKHEPIPELPPLQSISASQNVIGGVTRDGSAVLFSVSEHSGGRDFMPKGIFKTHPVQYK